MSSKFALGLPTWGKVTSEWAAAYAQLQWPLGCNMTPLWIKGEKIDDARNQIVKEALNIGASHVLFIADDVIPPPNIAIQLLARNKPIVTGVYWTKTYPPEPYIWRGVQQGPFLKWKVGEFFQIDMAGCDALMVETSVFRNLPEPWFHCNWTWEPDDLVSPLSTEDFHFYVKARAAGYEVWCDSLVQCNHQDRDTGVMFGCPIDSPQADPLVKKSTIKRSKKVCAELGSGNHTEGYNGQIVRIDIDESVNPDIRADVRKIPQPDDTFDDVRAAHVLEHFNGWEAPALIREWLRITKIGGTLKLTVPNISWACQMLADKSKSTPQERAFAYQILWGEGNKGEFWEHRNGFDEQTLPKLCEIVGGHKSIKTTVKEYKPENRYGSDIVVEIVKKETPGAPVRLLPMWNKIKKTGLLALPKERGKPQAPKEKAKPNGKVKVPAKKRRAKKPQTSAVDVLTKAEERALVRGDSITKIKSPKRKKAVAK